MTEINVTIDDNADAQFLRRIFENVKGVVKTTIINSDKPGIQVSLEEARNGQTVKFASADEFFADLGI